MRTSTGEAQMELLLKSQKIEFKREHRFHDTRKWRFDFALPEWLIAIEVEGGVFTQGRHTRGTGFTNDLLKYNAAVTLGWVVLRYTTGQINMGVIEDIYKTIARRRNERRSAEIL